MLEYLLLCVMSDKLAIRETSITMTFEYLQWHFWAVGFTIADSVWAVIPTPSLFATPQKFSWQGNGQFRGSHIIGPWGTSKLTLRAVSRLPLSRPMGYLKTDHFNCQVSSSGVNISIKKKKTTEAGTDKIFGLRGDHYQYWIIPPKPPQCMYITSDWQYSKPHYYYCYYMSQLLVLTMINDYSSITI